MAQSVAQIICTDKVVGSSPTCGSSLTNKRFKKMKELQETATMMCSADYKERFCAEYYQLETRYEKLKAMVEKWDKGELSFTPTCLRSTYDLQLRAMADYKAVLEMRANIEGVEL